VVRLLLPGPPAPLPTPSWLALLSAREVEAAPFWDHGSFGSWPATAWLPLDGDRRCGVRGLPTVVTCSGSAVGPLGVDDREGASTAPPGSPQVLPQARALALALPGRGAGPPTLVRSLGWCARRLLVSPPGCPMALLGRRMLAGFPPVLRRPRLLCRWSPARVGVTAPLRPCSGQVRGAW